MSLEKLAPALPDVKNAMPSSATGLATWMRCNRLRAWEKLAGYETPGTEQTDQGTRVHAILEWYKKNEHLGVTIDRMSEDGAIAAEALPHVADISLASTPGASIEGEFAFRARHLWRGKIDIQKPWDIRDYKTTSNFKWALTPEALQHDPQAVLYMEKSFREMEALGGNVPGSATIQGTWIYLRKKNPASKVVKFSMTRAHARRVFAEMERVADEFQTIASAAPDDPAGRHKYVLDVIQPNPDACYDYGRPCPHLTRCNLGFFRNPPTDEGKKNMGLFERLQAANAFNGPANEPAVLAPTPAVLAPTPGGNPMRPRDDMPTTSRLRALEAMAAGAPELGTPPVVVVTPSGNDTFSPDFLAADTDISAVAPGQVNPPAKRKPGRPRKTPSVPPVSAQAAEQFSAPAPSAPVVLSEGPPPAVTAVVSDKPRFAPTPAVVADAVATTVAASPKSHRITTLFIGCVPRGGAMPADFDVLIAKAKIALGPQDYRLYDFGKGSGMLVQMFEAIVQHEKPGALMVVSPMYPEAVLCLSYLRSISDTVVESFR